MFAVTEDEILFDEVLQSGLEAELQRICGAALSTAALDAGAEHPMHRLDQVADDMWGAYITPPKSDLAPARHH